MGRITKIQQNSVDGQSGEVFNIGATFDNVFMNPGNNFTTCELPKLSSNSQEIK